MDKLASNNEEFIKQLMQFSNHGALMQVFVLTAIEKYAELLLDNEERTLKDIDEGLISGEAWIGCAKEVLEKWDKQYGPIGGTV